MDDQSFYWTTIDRRSDNLKCFHHGIGIDRLFGITNDGPKHEIFKSPLIGNTHLIVGLIQDRVGL